MALSAPRQTPLKQQSMEADERQSAFEENGFTILDFTSESIIARMFKWNVHFADDAIDRMEPFRTVEMHPWSEKLRGRFSAVVVQPERFDAWTKRLARPG